MRELEGTLALFEDDDAVDDALRTAHSLLAARGGRHRQGGGP